MRKYLYTILIAILFSATGPTVGGFGMGGNPRPNWSRSQGAFFEFAPASGAGLVSASTLCSQLQDSEKVGGWWCLSGDGTMASGSQKTLSANGTPITVSNATCPNGPDCAARTGQRLDSSDYYATTSFAASTGSMTVCAIITDHLQAGDVVAMHGLNVGFASNYSWYLDTTPFGSLRVQFAVSNGTTVQSAATDTGGTIGGVHLVCGTWDSVTGYLVAYIDGSASANSTLATRLNYTGTTSIHGYAGGAASGTQTNYGTFYTDTKLSAARIAAIARAVLADVPTGSKGEALTFTRASSKFCASSGGTGTFLLSNRPCITGGGISVEGASTNILQRSQEFENAMWTRAGVGGSAAPVVTPEYGTAPDGTGTADRVQFAAATWSAQASFLYQTHAPVGFALSTSVYLKGVSGSGYIDVFTTAPNSFGTCSFNETTWSRCVFYSSSTGTEQVYLGNIPSATDQNRPAADVLLWGAQQEALPYATSYIHTTSAQATRAAETADVAVGFTFSTAISAAATYTGSHSTWSTPPILLMPANTVVSNYFALELSAAGQRNVLECSNPPCSGGTYSPTDVTQTPALSSRVAAYHTGTKLGACIGGSCNTERSDTYSSFVVDKVRLGSWNGTGQNVDGVVSRVCADPSPTRCR